MKNFVLKSELLSNAFGVSFVICRDEYNQDGWNANSFTGIVLILFIFQFTIGVCK